MRIDHNGMEVATWQGLYGNSERQVVLTIPPAGIKSANYAHPRWIQQTSIQELGMVVPQAMNAPGYCHVRYLNESGEERSLLFAAVDHWILLFNLPLERRNLYTEAAAEALMALKERDSNLPYLPALSLEPAFALRRRLFGIAVLIAGLLFIGALITDGVLLWIAGDLLLFTTFALLASNTVRVQTGWHPRAKGLIITMIFLLSAVLSVVLTLVLVF